MNLRDVGIENMGSSKIVMTIGVPLGGRRIYRVSNYEEANGEYEISKEG